MVKTQVVSKNKLVDWNAWVAVGWIVYNGRPTKSYQINNQNRLFAF